MACDSCESFKGLKTKIVPNLKIFGIELELTILKERLALEEKKFKLRKKVGMKFCRHGRNVLNGQKS